MLLNKSFFVVISAFVSPLWDSISSSNAKSCSLNRLSAPYQYLQPLDLQIVQGSLSWLTTLDLSYSYFDTLPFNLSHHFRLICLKLNNCQNLRVIQDLPLNNLQILSASYCPLLENVQDLSSILRLRRLNLSNCSNLIELQGVENLVDLEFIDIRNCSTLTNKSWCVKLFKVSDLSPP